MAHARNCRKQLSDEAVDWFLQFQNAARVRPDYQAYSEWLLRSPAHVEEYLQVWCVWRALGAVSQEGLDTEALVAAARHHHETHNTLDMQARLGRQPGPRPARPTRRSSGAVGGPRQRR